MREIALANCTLAICALTGLAACGPREAPTSTSSLFAFRVDNPALIELDAGLQVKHEIPIALPSGCGLGGAFPAPRGPWLVIELSCNFGQAVLLLNADTAEMSQPVASSDSHFLAWSPTGDAIFLKLASMNAPRIVLQRLDGKQEVLPISELTYDIAPAPKGDAFVFSFSQGMGLGSEMWSAGKSGAHPRRIASDASHYLSLARWSADGSQIAFIKIPDSSTPFTVGELWVMQADGSQRRRLALADAGHGFAPAWSPDGTRIAFVARENPEDPAGDTSSAALRSNIHVVSVASGEEVTLTRFDSARVEGPAWQPNGEAIAFGAIADDRMTVFLMDLISGQMNRIPIDSICCAGWLNR
ncbi:MAG TPA: hypothetical protein VIU38_00765 [Anaerolineales bacterium]